MTMQHASSEPVFPRVGICVVCGGGFVKVGKQALCSDPCRRERQRQQMRERYRRPGGAEKRKWASRRNRLWHYGLTPEAWDELFATQDCACAACGSSDSGRYWHTDHCHERGVVRGILCHNCNTALGLLRDSRERLAALDAYLERTA